MKTILIEKIDGYYIVRAFGETLIDPVATKNILMQLHDKTDEDKAVERKANEIKQKSVSRKEAYFAAKEARKKGDKINEAKHMNLVELRFDQIKILETEMRELLEKKKQKDVQLWKENIVYFEPKKGEEIITDEQYEQLGAAFMAAEAKGNYIDVSGQEVVNNKGVKYVKDGQIMVVDKIGVKPDGLLLSTFTPEQLEQERYNYMSLQDIESEKQAAINNVAMQAVNYRSSLEIQGDSEALAKSQAWYAEQVSQIEDKYTAIIENRPS